MGRGGSAEKEVAEEATASVWEDILQESIKSSSSQTYTVVVLGDAGSGKTTLLEGLPSAQGVKEARDLHMSETPLEYVYIDPPKDDSDQDSAARIDVWQLAGGETFSELLDVALNPITVSRTVAVIVVDLSTPHEVMESVGRWVGVLEKQLQKLFDPMDPDEVKQLKDAVQQHVQSYSESGVEELIGSAAADVSLLPLADQCLTTNLGLPVLVVGCKADTLEDYQNDFGYDENVQDFLMQHLRLKCLNYGAGLIFTNSKASTGFDAVEEYLRHRLCGTPFTSAAEPLQKELTVLPAGWDTIEKVRLLDSHAFGDSDFNEVLKKPLIRATEKEIVTRIDAEEEQVFLKRMKEQLAHPGARHAAAPDYSKVLAGDSDVSRKTPGVAAAGRRLSIAAPHAGGEQSTGLSGGAANALAGAGGAQQLPDGNALTSFFQSLLNKERKPADRASSAAAINSTKNAEEQRKRAQEQLRSMQKATNKTDA